MSLVFQTVHIHSTFAFICGIYGTGISEGYCICKRRNHDKDMVMKYIYVQGVTKQVFMFLFFVEKT